MPKQRLDELIGCNVRGRLQNILEILTQVSQSQKARGLTGSKRIDEVVGEVNDLLAFFPEED